MQSRVIALVGTIAASHGTTRGWSPARLFSLLLPLHRRIVGACANNAYWLKGDLAATTCQLMALASRCNDSGDECTVLDVDFLCAALTSALGTARMLSARHRARFAILLGAAMPAYLTTATSWTTLSGYLTPLFKDQEVVVLRCGSRNCW